MTILVYFNFIWLMNFLYGSRNLNFWSELSFRSPHENEHGSFTWFFASFSCHVIRLCFDCWIFGPLVMVGILFSLYSSKGSIYFIKEDTFISIFRPGRWFKGFSSQRITDMIHSCQVCVCVKRLNPIFASAGRGGMQSGTASNKATWYRSLISSACLLHVPFRVTTG